MAHWQVCMRTRRQSSSAGSALLPNDPSPPGIEIDGQVRRREPQASEIAGKLELCLSGMRPLSIYIDDAGRELGRTDMQHNLISIEGTP